MPIMHTDRGHLLTEQRNPRSMHIDRLSIADAFEIINQEDRSVAHAVQRAKQQICEAVRLVVNAFEGGGRLLYVGAGTSGRLGVIDAAECPPTFMSTPEMVQGIIAGGSQAMHRSIEGAEDDAAAALSELAVRNVDARDVVMGIATGGTTPFVHAALAEARRRGARTVFLACVPKAEQDDGADVSIRVLTGPEALTGSTRLKAGTATKMVLNMITTIAMTRIGKVYENLMVDLNRQACSKLKDRAVRIVQQATDLERDAAEALLLEAQDVKTAIVMHHRQAGLQEARQLLEQAEGRLTRVLG